MGQGRRHEHDRMKHHMDKHEDDPPDGDQDIGADEGRQLVSALADGQLRGDALARSLQALADDAQARQAWQTYHLIGDVLRSVDLVGVTPQDRFMARFSQRLAGEAPPGSGRDQASRALQGRWRWAVALGSVVAAVAVALAAVGLWWALPPTVPVSAGQALLRDALLIVHRQFGGASVLQAPADGLHHITFEPPSR